MHGRGDSDERDRRPDGAAPDGEPQSPEELRAEDEDTARVVAQVQAAAERDRERGLAALYIRYFDRIFNYLRVALKDEHEAEDGAQQVFTNVIESIDGYERRSQPFRAWLFRIARNFAVDHLRKQGRIEVMAPEDIAAHRDRLAAEMPELPSLSWITDADLHTLIERLPEAQRQALFLRHVLDMTAAEIGEVLGRTPADVSMLISRAQRFLCDRLIALGREPTRREKGPGMKRGVPQARVLRRRRFSL